MKSPDPLLHSEKLHLLKHIGNLPGAQPEAMSKRLGLPACPLGVRP